MGTQSRFGRRGEGQKGFTLPGPELRPLGRPAGSQLLSGLCYRGLMMLCLIEHWQNFTFRFYRLRSGSISVAFDLGHAMTPQGTRENISHES
jgi:hypothetical protein